VIGLSHHEYALRHMALEWGVTPIRMSEAADVEELWARSLESGKRTGLLDAGDLVVLTAGTAVNIPGTTDMIKLAYA
jgi:pyruvate kinase